MRKNNSLYAFPLILLFWFFSCDTPMDSSEPVGDKVPETASEILEALDIDSASDNLILIGEDELGEDVVYTIENPAEWHPLVTEFAQFTPNDEVLCLGVQYGNAYNVLFEDGSASYSNSQPIPGDQARLQTAIKETMIADFDGDGIGETLYIYINSGENSGTLKAQILDGLALSEEIIIDGAVYDISAPSVSLTSIWDSGHFLFNFHRLQAVTCNIDSDDAAEVLVGVGSNAHLLQVTKSNGEWAITRESSKGLTSNITGLTAGDMDGDYIDEIVLTFSDRYALYTGSFDQLFIPPQEFFNLNQPAETCFSTTASGDFDGDRLDDLAIVYNNNSDNLAIYYLSLNSAGALEEVFKEIDRVSSNLFNHLSAIALDFDGDGYDELYSCSFLMEDLHDSGDEWALLFDPDIYTSGPLRVASGDVDGNGSEDIVFLNQRGDSSSTSYNLTAYGVNNAGTIEAKKHYFSNKSSSNILSASIAVGNVDDDSFMVRYDGHRMEYTNPIVIAALASPPYYQEIANGVDSYNYNEWVTSYAQTSGSGVQDSTSLGFSIGATVEADAKVAIFGIPLGRVYSATTISSQFDWRFSNTHMITKSRTFNCYGGMDRVIFTAVPMDIYEYEVLTDPDTTRESIVGNRVSISLPRDFSIYNLPLESYNLNNGPLDDVVLSHTPGVVSSYPSSAPDDALTCAKVAVAQSAGGDAVLSISVDETSEEEFAVDFRVDQSIGFGSGGVTALLNMGFHGGYSYTSIMTEGTEFSGTVGHLPLSYYNNPDYYFEAGLYAKAVKGALCYWEVGYWVE